jgi:uncharacterized protein (TIGR03435 family)
MFDPQAPPMPLGQRGGPGSNDPGRFTFGRVTLMQLMLKAYSVQMDQIQGPAWMNDFSGTNIYNVIATMPPDTTNEQFQAMLRNLLIERFQMKLHHETRNFPGYELSVAPGGPKLQETTHNEPRDTSPDPSVRPAPPKFNPDGSIELRPGPQMAVRTGKGAEHAQFQAQTMPFFASQLGNMVSRALGNDMNGPRPRVADETGLTGKYDFTLEFDCRGCQGLAGLSPAIRATMPLLAGRGEAETPAPQSASLANDPGSGLPNIFNALEKQLGLKLVKVKDVPVDVIVIDHAEKAPLEN